MDTQYDSEDFDCFEEGEGAFGDECLDVGFEVDEDDLDADLYEES